MSQFVSKQIANTQSARIYLTIKMNPDRLIDFVSLPTDRQEEIYLQVWFNEEQRIPQLLVGVAKVARDIPYIDALNTHPKFIPCI